MGDLLIDSETAFSSVKSDSRNLPYKNRFWNAITYEMSRTRIEYTRTVYSFLDCLADLGGLFGALGPLGHFLVFVLQYRGSYMFVMSNMLAPTTSKDKLRRQDEVHVS